MKTKYIKINMIDELSNFVSKALLIPVNVLLISLLSVLAKLPSIALLNSFVLKHEELVKQENDIREKLQIEVTKIKEKLENYLSNANNQIKINERINQGIKKLEKEEKNILKSLTYISKINKNQKDMKKLYCELMPKLIFYFDEKECNIKYNETIFNGIPNPKNIKIKDITYNSINISWEIDNENNIDINKIKYIIEIRKDNEKCP